jgi:hypothetical protein
MSTKLLILSAIGAAAIAAGAAGGYVALRHNAHDLQAAVLRCQPPRRRHQGHRRTGHSAAEANGPAAPCGR